VRHDSAISIRAYEERDFDDLVARWHESNRQSYPYVEERLRHTLEDARAFFRAEILSACRVWVAERPQDLVGLIAVEPPWIRQLSVFPGHQRRGIGTALLHKARECSPAELRLFTFRRNDKARAFYEKHGFSIVALGISPAPELEPDVEYRWIAGDRRRGGREAPTGPSGQARRRLV
jgi:putative acetyltransferase